MGAVFIGRYKIIEELGRGGMGVVYRGEDPILERQVAIKVLPPKKLTQKTVDRFLREAKTAARLDSPYIVKIHDIGQVDDIHYIVMEYVEGHTLSDMMEYDEVPSAQALKERLAVFHQVLEAVKYAHSHGVVHRDLKPDNIMVTGSGQVKVMDFGLAFFEGRHSLTEVGQVMGTAAYVSPEQAQGKVTDQKTDIYSLGVILFEMITGRWPFSATNPLEMFKKVAEQPAPSPRQYNKNISVDLEQIVLKTLKKAPAERFSTVNELLAAMRTCEKVLGINRTEDDAYTAAVLGGSSSRNTEEASSVPASPSSAAASAESEVNAALSALSELSLSIGELSRSLLQGDSPEPASPEPSAPPATAAAVPNIAGAFALPYGAVAAPTFNPASAPKPLAPGPVLREAIEHTSVDAGKPSAGLGQLGAPLVGFVPLDNDATLTRTAVAGSSSATGAASSKAKAGSVPAISPGYSSSATSGINGSGRGVASSSWMAGVQEPPGDRLENLVDRLQKQENERKAAGSAPEAERSACCPKCGAENVKSSQVCRSCGAAMHVSHFVIQREASSYFEAGKNLFEDGKYKEAIVEFLQSVAKDPKMGEAYLYLGRAYLELGEQAQARTSIERSIELLPSEPAPYLALAQFFQATEQPDLVLSALLHALDRDDGDNSTRLRLAFAYYEMGNAQAAIAQYEIIVGNDPSNLEANRQLGLILGASDRVRDAIPYLEQVCYLDPEDHHSYSLLSRLYIRCGELTLAQQALRNAIQCDPANATLHADLASLYLQQGLDKPALQELTDALDIDPGNSDASVELASLLYQDGQVVEAVKRLEGSLQYHPQDVTLHRNLGEIYMYANRLDQAMLHFEAVVKLDPASAELFNKLGRIQLLKNYDAESVTSLQKAVELHPVNSQYREDLAMAYYSTGQLPSAVQELQKASRLDYQNPSYHKALGIMLVDLGQHEEAVRQLNSSIELMPYDAQSHGMLGQAYIGQGLNNMAIKEFQKALELNGDFYLLNLPLARAYAHQGRNDLALQCFKRFLQRVNDNADGRMIGDAYIGMGDAYLRDKNYARAMEVYRAVLHRRPNEAAAMLGVAKVYLAKKDYLAAQRVTRQALDAEPMNAEVKIVLAEIESSQEKWASAANILQGAIKENPGLSKLHELLGRAYRKCGRFQDAIDVFAAAVQLFPNNAGQFLWLKGRVEYRQGQYEAAVWSYHQSLEVATGDYRIYIDLAKACSALQNNEDAYQNLLQARSVAPKGEYARIDKMIDLVRT